MLNKIINTVFFFRSFKGYKWGLKNNDQENLERSIAKIFSNYFMESKSLMKAYSFVIIGIQPIRSHFQ